MAIIPLDVQRRCERRWAARFSSVPQEHRERPRQQQQAAPDTGKRKTRRAESAGLTSAPTRRPGS